MRKVDLIPVRQGNAWGRRDQVEEHRLVALIKIIVNWVQSDVHGTGADRKADGRAAGYPIEPIVFAQPGCALLSVEIHGEFVRHGTGAQDAELRPEDGVLIYPRFRGIPFHQFEAHDGWCDRRIVDDTESGAVLPDFVAFPGRWKDRNARRTFDGDFDGFVTFDDLVESRVGYNRGLTRADRDSYPAAQFLIIHAILSRSAHSIRHRQVKIGRASPCHLEDECARLAIAKLVRLRFGG